jgi:hypothetical protein
LSSKLQIYYFSYREIKVLAIYFKFQEKEKKNKKILVDASQCHMWQTELGYPFWPPYFSRNQAYGIKYHTTSYHQK